jgi:pimeloyl-ACP methyl ester carboxylesterase
MSTAVTLVLLTAIFAAIALGWPASGARLRQCLYDWFFERGYTANSLEPLTLKIPCGSSSETLGYFDSGSPRFGSGEPILMLHGFGGDKRNWLGMVKWLSPHHRLVAVDLAGHGQSDAAADGKYGFERQAERARCLAASLEDKLDRYHVLGHSMGGAVAIKLASLYPAEVLSLGLIAAAGARHQHTDTVMDYLTGTSVNPLIVSDDWSGGERLRFVTNCPWRLWLVSRVFDKALTDEALASEDHFERIFEDLKARETDHPLTCEDLDRDRPTFYLYGDKDRVLRPYWAGCFSNGHPDSWVPMTMEGVGHTPFAEQAKKTAMTYLDFLQAVAR